MKLTRKTFLVLAFLAIPFLQAAASTGYAGTIEGDFSVTPMGQASYEIPIAALPATGGLAPHLSITYNSSSKSGLLGYGFDLTGLSIIGRTPRNLMLDSIAGGVDFTANDRFMLDGQRLVAIQTVSGSERLYETEVKNFARVTAYGPEGDPTSFKVESKDGITYEYRANTRILQPGTASPGLFWMLTRASDTSGNYFTVNYQGDNTCNEIYPTRIDYTGNTAAGLQPYASVRLSYEDRPDTAYTYIHGHIVRHLKCLSSIGLYYGESMVREYRMGYTVSSYHKLLTSVTEIASDGTQKNPTTFQWHEAGSLTPSGQSIQTVTNLNHVTLHVGDFSGDGKDDFVALPADSSAPYNGWQLFTSTGSGFTNAANGSLDNSNIPKQVAVADFNGDGRADLAIVSAMNSSYDMAMIYLSTGTGFQQPRLVGSFRNRSFHVLPVESNGDGASDLLLTFDGDEEYRLYQSSVLYTGAFFINLIATGSCSEEWGTPMAVDFNGDGLTDVINVRENCFALLMADGQGGYTEASIGYDAEYTLLFGDFNGDGRDDYLNCAYQGTPFSSGWMLLASNGMSGVRFLGYVPQPYNPVSVDTHVADVNGDGYADLLTVNKTGGWQPRVYLNDCRGHFYPQPAGSSPYGTDKWNYYFGDFNGDGKTEFVCTADYQDASWKGYKLFLLPDGPVQLLAGITDGLGNVTEVGYKNMSDPSVHTRGSSFNAYATSFSASWPVVHQVKTPDGLGGQHTTTYHYEDALMHHRGRGMLGFSKVSATDGATGIVSTTEYAPSVNRYVMSPVHTETTLGTRKLSETDISYIQVNPGTEPFVHLPRSVTEKVYEYSSGLMLSETQTENTYDTHGNLTRSVVTEGDITTTTVNTYSDDETAWHLGRLTASTVTKQGTAGTMTRRAQFEYDGTTGLLKAEVSEPYSTTLGYRKTYRHDAFGNITSSTTSPLNTAYQPRTDSTTYDARGRFIMTQVNSLGHTVNNSTSDSSGLLAWSRDAGNIRTSYAYDSFGRCTISVSPLDKTVTTVDWSAGHADAPATALYYTLTESTGQPYTLVFSDCLGRTVRTVSENAFGQKVYADVVYNAKGQVWKTSEPYFPGSTPLWNVSAYDAVGRMHTQTDAAGAVTTFSYDGYTTTVTDALGHTTMREEDSHGRLIRSTDHEGGTINYQYDVEGHCTQLTGPRTTVMMEYDLRGNRTKLDDPDLGIVNSVYNAYGELVSQTDPKGTTTYAYDRLGRLTTETRPDVTVNNVYDTRFTGALTSTTASNGTSTQYYYDAYGRVTQQRETVSGRLFTTATTYNAQNKVATITYPSGLQVRNGYSPNGIQTSVADASTSATLWQLNQQNARGQATKETLGNSLATVCTYDATTGRLTAASTPGLLNWTYGYDAVGNLVQRKDVVRNMTEGFAYDALGRLVTVSRNGQVTQQSAYDAAGNVTSRTGVGHHFAYAEGTNRLVSLYADSPRPQLWDDIRYTSFHKISHIARGSDSVTLTYGPDKSRRKAVTVSGGVTETRYYVGSLYEESVRQGDTTLTCYIFAAGRAVAIHETSTQMGTRTLYLHRDHLGSVIAYTDASGSLAQELSYDAWGRRRDPATWKYYGHIADAEALNHWGFTGHEHLDLFEMVNMDGRMYDPVLGRFLTPDPYVQAPGLTQGLNRYTYCLNNPLLLTDPTGYSWLGNNWKSLVASAVGIAVSAITAGSAAGLTVAIIAGAAGGAAGALTGALLNGANFGQAAKATLKGAFWGAASGFLNYASGEGALLERLFKHTFSQGFLEGVQGGNAFHGMMMGAVSSLGGYYIDKYQNTLGKAGEIAASAVLGGTVDELGGGKFANGAITSAFSTMFNEMMHPQSGDDTSSIDDDIDPWMAATCVALTASAADGPLPIGEIVGVGAFAVAATYDLTQRVYVTYTLTGPDGQIYVGRTSGFGTPEQLVNKRYSRHHMKAKGFGRPTIDRAVQGAQGKPAIRGREQQLMDYYGGIGSPRVANKIRGVSKYNPAGRIYHKMSNWYFGPLAPYSGY